MSVTLKKTLNFGLAILLMTSVGVSTSRVNVNARHVRTYRYHRIRSRRARRSHRTKRIKRTKRTKRTARKRSTKRRYRYNKRSRRYVRSNRKRRTRRYRFSRKLRHFKYQRTHAKLHVRKYRYRTRRHKKVARHQKRQVHQNVSSNVTQPQQTSTQQDSTDPYDLNATNNASVYVSPEVQSGIQKLANALIQDGYGFASKSAAEDDAANLIEYSDLANETDNNDINNMIGQYQALFQSQQQPQQAQPTPQQILAKHPNIETIPNQTPYIKATEQDELQDLNNDRAQLNEEPLQVDPTLQQGAEMRAYQLSIDFSHDEPYTGTFLPAKNSMGENIAEDVDVGNAKSNAKNINNDLFTEEKPSEQNPQGGGHYETIKQATNTYDGQYNGGVGIGAYYKDGNCYVSEDFGPLNLNA